jgi:hypothetical protein
VFPDDPPPELPGDRPSAARIYDALLGGHHNFAADRAIARRLVAINPDIPAIMAANRAFLRRAVTFLAKQGIDQFLDVGAGIPAVGSTHEVAAEGNAGARVVYVDSDPIAVRQAQAIIHDIPTAGALRADAREPAAILAHPTVRALLDLRRPVAVLLIAVLHFIPEDTEALAVVEGVRDALAPGSYHAIAHATTEGVGAATAASGERLYQETTNPGKARTRAVIARFFAGLTLVEPGLVYVPQWRPEGPHDRFLAAPERSLNLGGVGRTS